MNIRQYIDELEANHAHSNESDFMLELIKSILKKSVVEQERILKYFLRRNRHSSTNNLIVDTETLRFLKNLLKLENLDSSLILHPDIGYFSKNFENELKPKSSTIVTLNALTTQTNECFTSHSKVITENPISFLASCSEQFDLILSFPPIGWREKFNDYPNIFEHGHSLLVEASKKLKANGKAVFILSPNTISTRIFEQLKIFLKSENTSFSAIINLPNGFYPSTGLSPLLIIIEKKAGDEILVGRYDDSEDNSLLVNAYHKHKSNRSYSLGKWLNQKDIRPIYNLEASEKLDLISKRTGLKEYRIKDIFEIECCHPNQDYSEPRDNILYTHIAATASNKRALSSLDVEGNSITNYHQLKMHSDEVNFEYIKLYFKESPYISVALSEFAKGAVMQSLNKASLEQVRLFLPSLELQEKAVKAQTKIKSLQEQLTNLSENLWGREKVIYEEINRLGKDFPGKKFEIWVEGIHYPLASILWNVHTAPNLDKKASRLLLFFEALSEYLAIIQLSAYQQNPSLCSDVIDGVFENLSKNNLSLDRASFGTWNSLFEQLAKKTRSMINGSSDEKDWIQLVFKTSNNKLIESLVDKKFITIFKEVVKTRNEYKGHSGETGESESIIVVDKLQGFVDQLASTIEYICDHFSLVRATLSRKRNGLWLNSCEILHGTRHDFQNTLVENTDGIDEDCLSLLNVETNETIPILPLVKIEPGPETKVPACYFYNRTEIEGETRFVSYHFGNDSEFKSFNQAVNQIINKEVC
jgi:hypothetical protein